MSTEILSKPHDHFEAHHADNGEVAMCMQHNGECSVLVEIAGNEEERQLFLANTQKALELLDQFFGGRFAEAFAGLRIQIGDGLVEGGAQAFSKENRIAGDRQKMKLSLAESEEKLRESFEPGERTRVMSPEEANQPGSVWIYEAIHEIGHILDDTTPGAQPRVAASESPTKYGREPDEWHDTKDHEAFAEGFTHMVFGAEVTPAMRQAVEATVHTRLPP